MTEDRIKKPYLDEKKIDGKNLKLTTMVRTIQTICEKKIRKRYRTAN